jgi:hypothetical protein
MIKIQNPKQEFMSLDNFGFWFIYLNICVYLEFSRTSGIPLNVLIRCGKDLGFFK